MTRIDFYGIETADLEQRLQFACRLVQKAYQRRHKILIQTSTREMAEQVDEALWQLDASAFIPHNLAGEGPSKAPPVQINWEKDALGHHDILLNLSDDIPDFYARFDRILEIVATQHESAEDGRQRFRFYKERGHPLNFHQQKTSATG